MAPLIEGFHPGYERKGIYTLDDVFAQLGNSWAIFDGDIIPVVSLRYQVFKRSLTCVCCGLQGSYFAKERSARKIKPKHLKGIEGEALFKATTTAWHFNLYALTLDGREILMTKDHILPRSKGGADSLENLQTMCRPCNARKQDNVLYQPLLPFEGGLLSL